MQHYMYFQNDPSRNFFNSKDSRASGLMTVSRDDNGNVDPLAGQLYELSLSDNVVNAGDKVVIVTEENATLTQTQGTPVQIQNNGSSSIIIDTQSITQNETLIFSASATNSNRTETFTFEVVVDDGGVTPPPTPEPDPDTGNAWSSSTTYVGGEVVSYAGKEWKAQWWTQGGDDPETTYSSDKWGVWRPAN